MTIQEAIKSGKNFKRPIYREWKSPRVANWFCEEDILATDWEVEEKNITVTKEKLNSVYREYFGFCQNSKSDFGDFMMKKLGE